MAVRRPPYLLRLKVTNFRSLRDVEVRATDSYTLRVSSASLPSGRSEQPRYFLRRAETFAFKRAAGPGRRITVKGGHITFHKPEGGENTASLREGSLGLSTLPKLDPEDGGEQVEALANLFASFRVFDVDVAAARRPSPESRGKRLENDASNLAAFLAFLSDQHPDRFAALQRDATAFIPGLTRLEFTPIGGAGEGTVLTLVERGLPGATTLQEASYGSIRALALLALLYDPAPPRLTCIEEIDHGLHPHILDRLVELLREASSRTQFLIATHSPALVNRLTPEELIVCERGADAASRIPAITAYRSW